MESFLLAFRIALISLGSLYFAKIDNRIALALYILLIINLSAIISKALYYILNKKILTESVI